MLFRTGVYTLFLVDESVTPLGVNMFKIAQFAALLLITSVALGQDAMPEVPPTKDSDWVCPGRWVCVGEPDTDWYLGRGLNCIEAKNRLDEWLNANKRECLDGSAPIKEYAPCYEDGGSGGGENPGLRAAPPQDGPWVIRLIYQFGNGQTLAARGTGCTKREACQQAWCTILWLAETNCGVCRGTGQCFVLKQPCCQQVPACRSRARCRHR